MRILCVAEKPSIARSITSILSGGQHETRATRNKFIRNYDFHYPPTRSNFIITAVSGHLMEYDFESGYRQWTSCDPFALFEAPVSSHVTEGMQAVADNLKTEARRADELMIWTDCDREGENIGSEIAKTCRQANARIRVTRARFSAIIPQQIHRAAQNPVRLDQAQADAVEARIVLDLRLGAAFTRMQTLQLQRRFAQIKDAGKPVSYGPCQFPTLGFVVARYEQVRTFQPETFCEEQTTEFSWRRGRLFDMMTAAALYEHVMANSKARVTKKNSKGTKKWKPLPLTTVELQKAGSRLLKMAPKKVLDVAEKLYQQGFLSYPRTETDQYDPQFDFMTLIEKQTSDPNWGAFATQLRNGDLSPPRKGQKNDKAHPPIHPTNYAGNLTGDEKRVYEFVTRRFLASCSKDAEGQETTIELLCGGECFYASGLVVLTRNYLEVYPYDKWTGRHIPQFVEGEEFMPSVCELREGVTTRPNYLTEADLVNLMDKNGIGTDATIAQHIQTIVDREYVIERMEGATKYLVPSTLGVGLVEGYNDIGFDKSLSKPQLRRETERAMVEVCERTKSKNEMLAQSIEQYKDVFIKARRDFDKVISSVSKRIEGGSTPGQRDGARPGADDASRNNGRESDNGDDEGGNRRGRGRRTDREGSRINNARTERAITSIEHTAPRKRVQPNNNHDSEEDEFDRLNAELDDPIVPIPNLAPLPRPPRSSHQLSASTSSSSALTTPTAILSSISLTNEVTCYCNKAAVARTVSKDGPNKGRKFWKCGNSNICEFFQWSDSTAQSGPSAASNYFSGGTGDSPDASIDVVRSRAANASQKRRCRCDLTAVQRTVVREGPNHGRVFWSCPNSERARCGYFEWEDGASSSSNSLKLTSAISSGGSGDQSGSCFKCGQSGHWSSSCSNDFRNAGSSKMAPSTSGNGQPGECYKCGEPGHWASSCTSAFASGDGRKARIMSAGPSTLTCFKCGDEGHSGYACSNGPRASSSRPNSLTGTNATYGTCYKCGQEGHFSNVCSGESSTFSSADARSKSRSRTTTKRMKGVRGGALKSASRSTSRKASKGNSRFAAADD